MPLFSSKCWSLPHCPKWCFFSFRLARAVGNSVWGLMEKTKEKAESVLFSGNPLYQGNNYKPSPSSPESPRSWQLSALAAVCLSRASPCRPRCGFLCSAAIPMTIWNPNDPAHVKWVKYLGTSQRAEDGGPDSETFGWSCPVGICSDTSFSNGSRTRLMCYKGSLLG